MNLFPYQATGVEFLKGKDKALLADGMGLGKTPQAIVAARDLGARKVVVICPAIARENWRRELVRWGYTGESFIESYDRLVRRKEVRQTIASMAPDVLILDEAHYLKTRTSKRAQAVYGPYCNGKGLASTAKRVWLLTGTPAPNNVSELYPHIKALWPAGLPGDGSFNAFLQHYCITIDTVYGLKVVGNKNVNILRESMRSIMLRRKAEDVLKDLPPIVWHDVAVEADEIDPELKAIEASPEVKALRAVLEDPEAELDVAGDIAMATLRRLTGVAKANVVGAMLAEELEAKAYDKVIVFAHHKDVIATLRALLEDFDPVVIDGSTSQTARQQNIDRFQSDGSCRVFVGQITACATAVTLHAASQVVFAEASWTPSDNLQAAKRAHRIGQTRPVIVRMIGLAGSIDEAVMQVLARKSQMISELLED